MAAEHEPSVMFALLESDDCLVGVVVVVRVGGV